MTKTLGGSIFIRNAIRFDYCVEEAIKSVLDICDDFVVLDCQSDDGTTDLLKALASSHPKIRLFTDIKWECADNYERLKILANQAIEKLDTDWHFMIQGDEVLHESSHPFIRQAIESEGAQNTFLIRRIHLFGNLDNYIRHDLPTPRKPASDSVIRLGRKGTLATGDAESLAFTHVSSQFHNQIVLFHYGYVRKSLACLTKPIDMQSWFHGKGSDPDPRIVKMHQGDQKFKPEEFFSWDELAPLYMSHPVFAQKWVEERRGEHPSRPEKGSL